MGMACQLYKEGLVASPPWFQFALGIPWGAPANAMTILSMKSLLPPGSNWAAFGISRWQIPSVKSYDFPFFYHLCIILRSLKGTIITMTFKCKFCYQKSGYFCRNFLSTGKMHIFSIFCFCFELSMLLGGHVRVGLEDNLYEKRGVFASNGTLVAKAKRIVEELGGRAVTPQEARNKLQTFGADQVKN